MRQLATAWDGVALEICGDRMILSEDGVHVGWIDNPTMSKLRKLAWERARDRMRKAWDLPDESQGPIIWTTYP